MDNQNRTNLWRYQAKAGGLEERVIIITGATGGIGRALSLAAARLGATVILVDKIMGALEALYDEIEAAGGPPPMIYPVDMVGATREDYATMADALETHFGRLDGLVNNAGWIGAYTPVAHYDMKVYHEVMMVNLHAPFMLTQAMLPLLEKAHDPSVVFSTHRHDAAYSGAYGIAKAGLESMMKILADEYDIESPIRFNGVDPGIVNTAMRRLNFPGEDWSQHPDPVDVIAPYLYFLGPESRGVTGVNCTRDTNS